MISAGCATFIFHSRTQLLTISPSHGLSAEWLLPRALSTEFVGITSNAAFQDLDDGTILPNLFVLEEILPGDATGDGSVGFDDFLEFSSVFGIAGPQLTADFGGNGSVDFGDFLTLSSNFGTELDPGTTRFDAFEVLGTDVQLANSVGNDSGDVYSFTLTEDSRVTIQIQDVEEGTDFRLYRENTDADGGDFDSDEVLEELVSVTGNRVITETLAGHSDGSTYYLRVTPRANVQSSGYKLNFGTQRILVADLHDSGGTRENSEDVDLLDSSPFTGVITAGVDADTYKFTLMEDSTVTINIRDVEENTYFRLYRENTDADGGDFDSDEVLEELVSVTGNRVITETLAGHSDGSTYYLRVTPWNNSTSSSYELSFSSEALVADDLRDPGGNRDNAGPIDLSANSEITGVITAGVDADTYKFTLTEDSTVTINISDVEENTYFRLYRENTDADGGDFDSDEVLEELVSVTGNRVITETLAGHSDGSTYYLRVTPWNNSTSSSYELSFSSEALVAGDLRDPGGNRDNAGPIDLSANPEITGVITAGVDADTYKFTLTEDSTVTINISDVEENTYFRLYRENTDADGGEYDSDEVLEELTSVTGNRTIVASLIPAETGSSYYLRVTPWSNSTSSSYVVEFASPLQASAVDLVLSKPPTE